MKEKCPNAFVPLKASGAQAIQNLKPLYDAADEIRKEGALDGPRLQILDRFQLSCARVSVGEFAYRDLRDDIRKDLRDSEHGEPLFFVPGEFIPAG